MVFRKPFESHFHHAHSAVNYLLASFDNGSRLLSLEHSRSYFGSIGKVGYAGFNYLNSRIIYPGLQHITQMSCDLGGRTSQGLDIFPVAVVRIRPCHITESGI